MSRRAPVRADGTLTEAAWQSRVLGYARFYGWRLYHPPDNRPVLEGRGRGGRQQVSPGFPDVTLLRHDPELGPELVIAELKAERRYPSPEQRAWLDAWRELAAAVAGMDAALRSRLEGEPELVLDAYRPATIDVYVWRPSDEQAVNERLGRGRALVPMT